MQKYKTFPKILTLGHPLKMLKFISGCVLVLLFMFLFSHYLACSFDTPRFERCPGRTAHRPVL